MLSIRRLARAQAFGVASEHFGVASERPPDGACRYETKSSSVLSRRPALALEHVTRVRARVAEAERARQPSLRAEASAASSSSHSPMPDPPEKSNRRIPWYALSTLIAQYGANSVSPPSAVDQSARPMRAKGPGR